jgi:hypothetical protein
MIVSSVLLSASACSRSEPSASPPAKSDLPERFALATEPPSPIPVSEARARARTGDSLVVVGRVGGAKKVFVDGAALFTLVDPSLPACGEGRADDCHTPWDYCCNDPAELAAHTLTVEFSDGGTLLKQNPRGFHGLDHLKTVVVQGSARKDEAGNLTLVATGIFVRP